MPLFGLSKSDVEKMQAKRDVNGLVKALSYKNVDIRRAAAEAIRKSDDPRVVNTLIDELNNPNSKACLQTVDALRIIGGRQGVLGLITALKNPDLNVRLYAVDALRTIGGEQGVVGLITALDNQDAKIRLLAVDTLLTISGIYGTGGLLVALKKADKAVRFNAAIGLGNIGDARAVDALSVALINDQETTVRAAAAEALVKINHARKENGSVNELTQDQVISSKVSSDEARAAEGLVDFLEDQSVEERIRKVRLLGLLGKTGNAEVVDELIGDLRDPNATVRFEAIDALGNIGDNQAVERLVVALNDPDSFSHSLVVGALGKIGNSQAIEGLIAALKDQDWPVRFLAVESLAKIGCAKAVDGLVIALKDQDAAVHLQATKALARINAGAIQGAPSKANRPNEGAVLCTGCGKEMASSLEFCSNCGKKLVKVAPVQSSASKIGRSDEKRSDTQEQQRFLENSRQPAVDLRQEPEVPYKKGSFIGQKYDVIKELGHGGFGIVYLVTFHETNIRFFALKTFRKEYLADTETREMFRKEANVWIELGHHPYLVRAYFVDEVSGRLYIAMEYIAPNEMGLNSLDGYLERQPPDLAQSLRWAIQFCYGMEYAYSKGIRCHRDIKPANIMIGADKTVKITDFGLAGVLSSASAASGTKADVQDGKVGLSTMEGKSAGTPTHMPPEQFINAAACDERSDIYSFGIVLYQMATGGRLPFTASSPLELYRLHNQAQVPWLDSPLFSIIQRCLEKIPERRYHTFKMLRADLESLLKRQTGETIELSIPDESRAAEWSLKGVSHHCLGHFDEAIKCYDKALEINPQLAEAWLNKGISLVKFGRFDDAIKCYDRALEINPQYAETWSNKGNSLGCLGRFDEAIKCYDKALEINPQLAEAWFNKGASLHCLGRFDEAIKCQDKALEINPQYAAAWGVKGNSLNGLGRFDEAIKCHDKALEINPQNAETWLNKGLSLEKLGRSDEAIKCHDKALEINPQNAETWLKKGNSHHNLGRFDEAIKCYDKALEINPQLAEAWLFKGVAQQTCGLRKDAALSYRKFIELAPASRYAKAIEAARAWLSALEGS